MVKQLPLGNFGQRQKQGHGRATFKFTNPMEHRGHKLTRTSLYLTMATVSGALTPDASFLTILGANAHDSGGFVNE